MGARPITRRLLWVGAMAIALAAGSAAPAVLGQRAVTPPAPNCTSPARLTPSQTEGPFYKGNTPERTNLVESGMTGTKLIVTGYVLTRECRPVAKAWLDFWQADDRGNYDNAGFRLRGHQFTDTAGIYYLETVTPGLYPGRTRHIHVKVRTPNGPILTTQLYIPGENRNQSDGIFNPALVMTMRDGPGGGKVGFFNFVVDLRAP
ncbi:MAG TPA: dioxygenase [bacterium]|jgi:protocatechuate 3,4-dioxygenase beta subunit|nr:dioxygenase [bacterium]